MVNVNEIVDLVMDSLTSKDAEGNVTDFDFEGLKSVIKELTENKKALADHAKEAAKAKKAEKTAENAEVGKAYVDTLAEGAEVSYTMADGSVITGTLVKVSDKTATIRLPHDSKLLVGKDTSRKNYDCRYVKFDKICVPTDSEELSEEIA